MHDTGAIDLPWLRAAMHELCQPLTALECRLYLATMDKGKSGAKASTEMTEAIDEALAECQRLISRVRLIQDKIHQTAQLKTGGIQR